MDKRDFHERYHHEDRRPRDDEGRRPKRDDGPRPRREEGRRPEGPRPRRPKFDGHPRFRPDMPRPTVKTKLFTTKEDLVEYVNGIGEDGNKKIDIFKIEDGLYKVEVKEKVIIKKELELEL